MSRYSIIIGNIGTIDCQTKNAGMKDFADYVRQSKAGYGRAAGEPVTLFDNDNGEIVREYNEGENVKKEEKQTFYFEHTDLFGGECNYCFLNRFAVKAKSLRGAVTVVSKAIGLNHRFDGMKYVSRSGCTAFYQVDWELSEDRQKEFTPLNF